MKLIWTKSKNPLSRVICLITGQDCSHFAIVFMSRAKGLMFQSNLLGTHPKFFETARNGFVVMHEEDLPLSLNQEEEIWNRIVLKYDGRRYDFMGALALGWYLLRERILGIPRPAKNRFNSSGAFFCDEIYGVLAGIDGVPQIDAEAGLLTPHELWECFKGLSR